MKPWNKQKGESSKAFGAFRLYREMGAARSIPKVRDAMGKDSGYDRWLEKWSSKFDWVARSEAFDAFEDEQKQAERQAAREAARDVLVNNAMALANKLVALALGNGKGLTSAQVAALRDALDRAGVSVPKKVDLDVSGTVDQRTDLGAILGDLEDKTTAELTRIYFEAIEGAGGD